MIRTTLPLLLLTACTVTEESFPDDFAASWCRSYASCDDREFHADFRDMEDCVAETRDYVEDQAYGGSSQVCHFQEDLAATCITDLSRATCADIMSTYWKSRCTDAWDCVTLSR